MVYSYELRNNGFLNDISDFYEKFSPSFIAWNQRCVFPIG